MRCQVEDRTVMRSREPGIEPAQELGAGSQCRHPLVIDGCENSAADQNLAPGIAFAFRLADACDEPVLLHPQASEALVECLKTDAHFFGLWHWASFRRLPAMQVQCRFSVPRERLSEFRDGARDMPPAGRREPAEGALWRFSRNALSCAFGRREVTNGLVRS
jgi:hypothetical protein